jgi:hypothetical protein
MMRLIICKPGKKGTEKTTYIYQSLLLYVFFALSVKRLCIREVMFVHLSACFIPEITKQISIKFYCQASHPMGARGSVPGDKVAGA